VPETPHEVSSPAAAGRPALRLFAWVLFATLFLDAATAQLLNPPAVPDVGLPGRLLIGLAAGFVGMRDIGRLPRTVAAAWGAMVLATVLTLAVYVLTGRAAADRYGPAATIALLLAGVVADLAAPTAGGLAWLAVGRRPRKA
jgi:hypothetical protein